MERSQRSPESFSRYFLTPSGGFFNNAFKHENDSPQDSRGRRGDRSAPYFFTPGPRSRRRRRTAAGHLARAQRTIDYGNDALFQPVNRDRKYGDRGLAGWQLQQQVQHGQRRGCPGEESSRRQQHRDWVYALLNNTSGNNNIALNAGRRILTSPLGLTILTSAAGDR